MQVENPILKIGDRIKLLHMEDEFSVTPLTKGTVKSIVDDPFEKDNLIINVQWDNGSYLSVLSKHDVYRKISDKLNESGLGSDEFNDYVLNNRGIFKNFDWRFFREYLKKIRESGVINMFGSAQLLWMGRESIDRYFGENQEDNENFQQVLEMADESKFKLIQGTIKQLELQKKSLELPNVKRAVEANAVKLLQMYIVSFEN